MARPLLLVIDYPGRRESGRIADIRWAAHGFDVHDVMRDGVPDALHGPAYAAKLLADVDVSRVTGILAYCMAGHLAHEAAALVAAVTVQPPPLVLFDSGPFHPQTVAEECRSALEVFGGPQLAAVVDGTPGAGSPLGETMLRERPEKAVAHLREHLSRFAITSVAEDTDSEEEAAEAASPLVDHFLGWFTHLVAACNSTAPAVAADVLHVVSQDHPFRGDWPGVRSTRTVVVDCGRNELLADDRTRSAVLAHLSRTPSAH